MQGEEKLQVEIDVMDLLYMGLELGHVSLLEGDDPTAEQAEEGAKGRAGGGGRQLVGEEGRG